ncbi:MAG: Mg2+ and Co2+ transporter [Candidatus Tokpelaia sp. JSC189]|nr:MAG: Mg2+ and Co2+ transporter [Candidatus Tokpelaia sp. JSC189]
MADKTYTQPTDMENAGDAEGQNPQRLQKNEKGSLLRGLFAFLRSRQDSSFKCNDLDSRFPHKYSEAFSPQERLMLSNIVKLHQARVDDVMIPRSDIEAIEISTTLAETLRLFEKSDHSRMPVYASTLDDPRGMIHIRDVLTYITRAAQKKEENEILDLSHVDLNKPVGDLDVIRDVLFVPGLMLASQLFTRMQATRTQMALIIDEHGGTDGLASMEDIVELVLGNIEDEHDDDDIMIVAEADDSWLVDASTELEEMEETIGTDFKPGVHAGEVDTIGGVIVSALDRIPACGEIIEVIPGYRFQVLDADHRRIKRLRMRRTSEKEPSTKKASG